MDDRTEQAWCVAASTCIGLRRDHNEDAVVVHDTVLTGDMTGVRTSQVALDGPVVLAVADGLGGHSAGEVASRLVAEGLARRSGSLSGVDDLVAALHALNVEVHDAMRADPATEGMGTTVAGVLVDATHVVVFHVGDSRAYLRRAGRWELATDDDVIVPGSGILTNCFGGDRRFTTIDVTTSVVPAPEVEAVLVCTDGLSDLVDATHLAADDGDHPDRTVSMLRQLAFERGAHDNVSVVVARPVPTHERSRATR
jgi:PPM family protein phosphatase